jgi:hypothetical protein
MAVRDENFLKLHANFSNACFELIQITTRINQRTLHRLATPDQAAILLKRCDGHDSGTHSGLRLGCFGHGGDVAARVLECKDSE